MINLGWQKIDLTQTVREWYGRRVHEEKLRLLVDCTGCGKRYFLHLLDQPLKFLKRKQPYLPSDPNNIKTRWLPEHNSISLENIIQIPIGEGRRVTKRIAVTCHSIISCSLYKNSTSLYNNYGLKNIEAQLHQQQSVEDSSYVQQYGRKLIHRELTRLILKQETPLFRAQSNIYLREQSPEPSPHRPFLVLKIEMKRMRRTRRRAIDCVGAMYGQCCKESFYVSFKALGWDDWIIAPRGYFANYCRGECGGPFRTPDTFQTFHAHFIEEYRKMGLLNGMQPCCSPVKFSSMSLIYYGVDGIIKRDLPKMVVDECGCP